MNIIMYFSAYLLVLNLAVMLPVPVWAADEELTDSVYLDFDPVTGTFTQKLITPPTDPALIQSSADVPGSQPTQAVDGQTQTTVSTGQEIVQAGGGSNSLFVWGGIGIVLILVIGFFTRKSRQKPGW